MNCVTVFQEQNGARNLTKAQMICAKVQMICAKVQINLCLAPVQKRIPVTSAGTNNRHKYKSVVLLCPGTSTNPFEAQVQIIEAQVTNKL